jgi:hypothetical protein
MRPVALTLLAAALAGGCAYNDYYYPYTRGYESAEESRFIGASYKAVDRIAGGAAAAKGQPIVVATLVDVDDLERSSSFGRIVSEQVASRLAVLGYTPVELKLRGNVYVRAPQGELLLSREVTRVAREHGAPVVIVGTYARAEHQVFVSLKAVAVDENRILSGYDYAVALNENTRPLLKSVRNWP